MWSFVESGNHRLDLSVINKTKNTADMYFERNHQIICIVYVCMCDVHVKDFIIHSITHSKYIYAHEYI